MILPTEQWNFNKYTAVLFYTINFYVFTKNNDDPLLQVIWVERNKKWMVDTHNYFIVSWKKSKIFFHLCFEYLQFSRKSTQKKTLHFPLIQISKGENFCFCWIFQKKIYNNINFDLKIAFVEKIVFFVTTTSSFGS